MRVHIELSAQLVPDVSFSIDIGGGTDGSNHEHSIEVGFLDARSSFKFQEPVNGSDNPSPGRHVC